MSGVSAVVVVEDGVVTGVGVDITGVGVSVGVSIGVVLDEVPEGEPSDGMETIALFAMLKRSLDF